MPRGLRLAVVSSTLIAAIGCARSRPEREIASFQRALDRELAAALEPRAAPGLEAACHRDPIVWMHFIADGDAWRLLSVDARGQVGIWTERGLEQTWPLNENELAWVRDVETRERLSEDADWLRDLAKVPRPAESPYPEFYDLVIEPPESPAHIAPRDNRRWVGIYAGKSTSRDVTASGRWYAVGDGVGTLSVGRIDNRRETSMWVAPACEPLRWAAILDDSRLMTEGRPADELRYVNLRRGVQASGSASMPHAPGSGVVGSRVIGYDWIVRDDDHDLRGLAQVLIDVPELAWGAVRRVSVSADEHWVAVATDAGWLIREQTTGETRRVHRDADAHEALATISDRGTLATAGWSGAEGFVTVHPVDGQPTTHRLSRSPVGLAFVQTAADQDDTLWIGVPSKWDAFMPHDPHLLRLDPGRVPERHAIAGFDEVERVLGRMPVSTPTLVVAGGGVLGIERLTDRAVLRVVIHQRTSGSYGPYRNSPRGLSLIWLDDAGERLCRHDGGRDYHAGSPGIADAAVLVDAFLSGRACPR